MDEEAKVRAHGIFDVGASIGEPFKTVAPRFTFWVDMRLCSMASVLMTVVHFIVGKRGTWIVRQVYSNDTVSALAECGEGASEMKVFADKIRTDHKSRFKPNLAVTVNVTMPFLGR